jgi:hypothetical protein
MIRREVAYDRAGGALITFFEAVAARRFYFPDEIQIGIDTANIGHLILLFTTNRAKFQTG